MKKILYISNIEVPYKARFFNELSRQVHLTVLYERSLSSNRDEKWAKSIEADYEKYYLEGVRIGNERAFSTKILGYLKRDYDEIIIGCVNSPVQIFAMLYMKLMGIKYSVNFDGEMFFNSSGIKKTLKVMLLRGADKYYAAGEKSADVYKSLFGERIYPYYFSSLSKEEVDRNASCDTKREKYVLVVGQYFEYKGLDLAVQVARKNRSMQFVFVGMGKRTDKFIEELNVHDKNIKIIPFLQKEQLNELYQNASALYLPSRQECWGLVINEAASYGTPIVSTTGCGAAVEFLEDEYGVYLKKCDDISGIALALQELMEKDTTQYSSYLKEKSQRYTIQRMVEAHMSSNNC